MDVEKDEIRAIRHGCTESDDAILRFIDPMAQPDDDRTQNLWIIGESSMTRTSFAGPFFVGLLAGAGASLVEANRSSTDSDGVMVVPTDSC